jgi:chorismate dehydratase
MMRVGRIPYVNCAPVYGAIDRGIVRMEATLVEGVPTQLNRLMAEGALDISVISAVEYARDASRYLLLPDMAISCDGPVQSVMLFSTRPVETLGDARVVVSRSSMTSVALLDLLFREVWHAAPRFEPGDAETADLSRFDAPAHLVIGDAALALASAMRRGETRYTHAYDLGAVWRDWTGLPFVFAVWVAARTTPVAEALRVHAALLESRAWGLANLPVLAAHAAQSTGISAGECEAYLSGLDYGLGVTHLRGLTAFFDRLSAVGVVHPAPLRFLPAA